MKTRNKILHEMDLIKKRQAFFARELERYEAMLMSITPQLVEPSIDYRTWHKQQADKPNPRPRATRPQPVES